MEPSRQQVVYRGENLLQTQNNRTIRAFPRMTLAQARLNENATAPTQRYMQPIPSTASNFLVRHEEMYPDEFGSNSQGVGNTRLENNLNQQDDQEPFEFDTDEQESDPTMELNENNEETEFTQQVLDCMQRGSTMENEKIKYTVPQIDLQHNMKSKELRTLARKLKCTVHSNEKKANLIKMIQNRIEQEGILENFDVTEPGKTENETSKQRRDKHTVPRLLNIMFSSHFCDRVIQMYNRITRDELDSGLINDNSLLWQDIAEAFSSTTDNQYSLVLVDPIKRNDPLFQSLMPGLQKDLSARKLKQIWDDVVRNFKQCSANYHRSGQGDPDFFNFCKSQVVVYYLWCWLKVKPNLISFVGGRLPTQARLDTLGLQEEGKSTSVAAVVTPREKSVDASGSKGSGNKDDSSTRKRKSGLEDIADLKQEFSDWMQLKKKAFEEDKKMEEKADAVFQYQSVMQSITLVTDLIERHNTNPHADENLLKSYQKDLERLLANKEKLADIAFA